MVSTRTGTHESFERRPNRHESQPVTQKKGNKRARPTTPRTALQSSLPANVLDLQLDSGVRTRSGNSAGKAKPRIAEHRGKYKRSRLSVLNAIAAEPTAAAPMPQINNCVTPACLVEIFKRCGQDACRNLLPLVCKHWSSILQGPSAVWETISVQLQQSPPSSGAPPAIIDCSSLEKWLIPRAAGIQHLSLTFSRSSSDTGNNTDGGLPIGVNSSPTRRITSIRNIVRVSARTLRTLHIDLPSDRYPLKWSILNLLTPAAKELTELEISRIAFENQMPSSAATQLSEFTALKTLSLTWGDPSNTPHAKSEELPSALSSLSQLEHLKLSSRSISGPFPHQLFNLKALKTLELSECALSTMPTSSILLRNVESLSFAGNRSPSSTPFIDLQSLMWLGDLHSLKELNLRDTNLRGFPALEMRTTAVWEPYYKRLESLDLSHNPLGPFPVMDGIILMGALKKLNLSHCSISALSDVIADIRTLQKLDISDNNLVDLPSDVGDMPRLAELIAAGNAFPAVPAVLRDFRHRSALKKVDLSRCNYLEVSSSLAWLVENSALQELNMAKAFGGQYQGSSRVWLEELEQAFKSSGKTMTW